MNASIQGRRMPALYRHTAAAHRASRLAVLLCLALPTGADGQSALGRSPNLRPAWTLAPGAAALRIGHRFEFIAGGDQLLNLPTLTLGVGLPRGTAVGLDFTSNSEVVPAKTGGNETQFWLTTPLLRGGRAGADLTAAWNGAARSFDGALTAHVTAGRLRALGELRGFQDALGTSEAGAAWALGAVLRLTSHLELAADAGRFVEPDTLKTVWSAGTAIGIPGTPHTLSLHVTNGGATTLQGASRPKVIGTESLRYGFVFTIPLGSRRQWGRIFQADAAGDDPTLAGAAATVEIRMIALTPGEVRIRAGESVAWINRDPLVHTVTADDGSWDSGEIGQGKVFVRRFDRPGRYTYHCIPHPQMTGVVIVL